MQDSAIAKVLGRSPAEIDKVLGKPVSVGVGGTFREYGTRRSSWYVIFKAGRSQSATVTFRAPFAKPEEALAAVGLRLGMAKPVKQNLLLRRWERVQGFARIEVSSTDGRTWETIEVSR